MPTGIELIAAERERQVSVKSWDSKHDDEHFMGEMVGAAITYSAHALGIINYHEVGGSDLIEFWPWDEEDWKPSPDPIRNLVKAGALIAAEIDRLQRKES